MLRHFENDCIGKPGEPHHLKLAGAESELVHPGELENGVFAHARLHETCHCFAGRERFAALVINFDDAHARVVRKSCAAHFGNFRNFFGCDFEGFEFFDGGVPDASSIERLRIQRLKMLAAWLRSVKCAAARQSSDSRLNIVDALDIEDAGMRLMRAKNVLELLAVAHVESDFDARAQYASPPLSKVRMFAPVSLMTLVMPASIPGRSSVKIRRRTGNVACVVPAHSTGMRRSASYSKIFHVGTVLAVHGDAAAARDVADDVVTGNRIAALRAINHQVVVAPRTMIAASSMPSMRLTVETSFGCLSSPGLRRAAGR